MRQWSSSLLEWLTTIESLLVRLLSSLWKFSSLPLQSTDIETGPSSIHFWSFKIFIFKYVIFPCISIFFREQEIATTSLFFSTSQEIYFYHSKSLFTIFSSSSCLQLERSPIIHLNWQTWIRLAEYHWSFWDFSKIFQHHHLHLQIDFMCVSFSPSP